MTFRIGNMKKFAPFAALIGYLAMYYTGPKGLQGIIPDLTSISVERLQAHYSNLMIAAAAGVGLYLLKSIRLPPAMKELVTVVLYFIIGYQLALAIDPPAPAGYSGRVTYVSPTALNPYANGGGGM